MIVKNQSACFATVARVLMGVQLVRFPFAKHVGKIFVKIVWVLATVIGVMESLTVMIVFQKGLPSMSFYVAPAKKKVLWMQVAVIGEALETPAIPHDSNLELSIQY